LAQKDAKLTDLTKKLGEVDLELAGKDAQLAAFAEEMVQIETEMAGKDEKLVRKDVDFVGRLEEVEARRVDEVVLARAELQQESMLLRHMNVVLQQKDQEVGTLQLEVQHRDKAMSALQLEVQNKNEAVSVLQLQVQHKDEAVSVLQLQVQHKDEAVSVLQLQVQHKDEAVSALQLEVQRLQHAAETPLADATTQLATTVGHTKDTPLRAGVISLAMSTEENVGALERNDGAFEHMAGKDDKLARKGVDSAGRLEELAEMRRVEEESFSSVIEVLTEKAKSLDVQFKRAGCIFSCVCLVRCLRLV